MKHLQNFSHNVMKILDCIFDFSIRLKRKVKLKVLLRNITCLQQPEVCIRIASDMYIISVHLVLQNVNSFFEFKPIFGQKVLQIVNNYVLVSTSG